MIKTVNTSIFRSSRDIRADIETLVKELRASAKKGLNLGCGCSRIENLTNCDFFEPKADLKVDATDLSVFETESIDYIESNHMIEHLGIGSVEKALSEWSRVLCVGGVLVLTFPDFRTIARKWVVYSLASKFADFSEKLSRLQPMIVGSQENEGMFHRSVFDKVTISAALARHGFSVNFLYGRYPMRTTPSLIVIAQKV